MSMMYETEFAAYYEEQMKSLYRETKEIKKVVHEKLKTMLYKKGGFLNISGPPGSGKISMVESFAKLNNLPLAIFGLNKNIDETLPEYLAEHKGKKHIVLIDNYDCLREDFKHSLKKTSESIIVMTSLIPLLEEVDTVEISTSNFYGYAMI